MKYTPRIFSLVWASLAMATAGSGYMFSLYGPQLKASKGMSQFQISFVATCTNSGLFLTGPLFGYLVDRYYKHSHFLFLIAASLIALGYILTALEFAGVLPHTHYLITSLYFLLIGVGSSACYHKSLSTNIRNWPAQYRGLAIGVPVSAFGLSAFIFSKIASLFFYNQDHADHDRPILNVTLLLLFVGITGFVVNLAMVFLLKDLSSAAAGGAVVLERSSEELDSTSPLVDSSVGEEEVGEEGEVPGSGEQEGLVRGGGNHDQSFSNHQQQQQEVDISCFNQLDAYLLGLVMLSICGIGLMQTNNIGFILVSLFPESVTASDPAVQAAQNLHVSVISTCNFAGRLLCGFFSDFFFKKRRLFCNFSAPRIIWPLFASIFMLLGSIVGGVFVGGESVDDNLGLLFYVSVFLGLGYGCTWTAIPVIISEYFGVPRFATHWGAMTMLPAIGGSLTSLIFSLIYDHSKTTKSNDPNQSPPPPHQPQGKCHGVDCFRASYLFCMGLSIVCIATVCLVAIRRGRRHHRRRRPHAS